MEVLIALLAGTFLLFIILLVLIVVSFKPSPKLNLKNSTNKIKSDIQKIKNQIV